MKSNQIEDDEIILNTRKKTKKKSSTLTDDELFEQIMNRNSNEKKVEAPQEEQTHVHDNIYIMENNKKLEYLIQTAQYEEAEKLYQSLTKHVSLRPSSKKYNNATHKLAAYMYFITGQYDKAIKACQIIFTLHYEFTETLIMILTLLADKRIDYNDKIKKLIDQWWKINDKRLESNKYAMSEKFFEGIIHKYYELGMTSELYELLEKLSNRNLPLNEKQVNFLLKSMLNHGFNDEFCKKVIDLLNRNPQVLHQCNDLIKEINKVNVKFQVKA